jgi:DNA-binding response OmpR family regulator
MTNNKKILIVDDEQINVDFFSVMLSKLGYICDTASNGEEALEKVKANKPDLLLLDIVMPRMSGWDVTKILKADDKYKDIPIIMLSGMAEVKDKVEGFELGIDDYITKPFNFSEVLARVRAVLRSRELFNQLKMRESRLEKAEELSEALKTGISRLRGEINDPKALDETLKGLQKSIKDYNQEWESLKTKETGLDTLEERMRRENNG